MAARSSTPAAREDVARPGQIERFPDLLVVGLEDWDDVDRKSVV